MTSPAISFPVSGAVLYKVTTPAGVLTYADDLNSMDSLVGAAEKLAALMEHLDLGTMEDFVRLQRLAILANQSKKQDPIKKLPAKTKDRPTPKKPMVKNKK